MQKTFNQMLFLLLITFCSLLPSDAIPQLHLNIASPTRSEIGCYAAGTTLIFTGANAYLRSNLTPTHIITTCIGALCIGYGVRHGINRAYELDELTKIQSKAKLLSAKLANLNEELKSENNVKTLTFAEALLNIPSQQGDNELSLQDFDHLGLLCESITKEINDFLHENNNRSFFMPHNLNEAFKQKLYCGCHSRHYYYPHLDELLLQFRTTNNPYHDAYHLTDTNKELVKIFNQKLMVSKLYKNLITISRAKESKEYEKAILYYKIQKIHECLTSNSYNYDQLRETQQDEKQAKSIFRKRAPLATNYSRLEEQKKLVSEYNQIKHTKACNHIFPKMSFYSLPKEKVSTLLQGELSLHTNNGISIESINLKTLREITEKYKIDLGNIMCWQRLIPYCSEEVIGQIASRLFNALPNALDEQLSSRYNEIQTKKEALTGFISLAKVHTYKTEEYKQVISLIQENGNLWLVNPPNRNIKKAAPQEKNRVG